MLVPPTSGKKISRFTARASLTGACAPRYPRLPAVQPARPQHGFPWLRQTLEFGLHRVHPGSPALLTPVTRAGVTRTWGTPGHRALERQPDIRPGRCPGVNQPSYPAAGAGDNTELVFGPREIARDGKSTSTRFNSRARKDGPRLAPTGHVRARSSGATSRAGSLRWPLSSPGQPSMLTNPSRKGSFFFKCPEHGDSGQAQNQGDEVGWGDSSCWPPSTGQPRLRHRDREGGMGHVMRSMGALLQEERCRPRVLARTRTAFPSASEARRAFHEHRPGDAFGSRWLCPGHLSTQEKATLSFQKTPVGTIPQNAFLFLFKNRIMPPTSSGKPPVTM